MCALRYPMSLSYCIGETHQPVCSSLQSEDELLDNFPDIFLVATLHYGLQGYKHKTSLSNGLNIYALLW
jgi:hypothetical protein